MWITRGVCNREYVGAEYKEVVYDTYDEFYGMKGYKYENGYWVELPLFGYTSSGDFHTYMNKISHPFNLFSMFCMASDLVYKKKNIGYNEPVFDGRIQSGQAGSHGLGGRLSDYGLFYFCNTLSRTSFCKRRWER